MCKEAALHPLLQLAYWPKLLIIPGTRSTLRKKNMSLFENSEYQWRETYFVYFDAGKRPSTASLKAMLSELNSAYELSNIRSGDDGEFESLTLISKDDYAAMDLTCVATEEMQEQTQELVQELEANAMPDEKEMINRVGESNCRLEVYHFEQLVFVGATESEDEPDDFMDPGSLLVVLNQIAEICDGIVVDPQSNSFL